MQTTQDKRQQNETWPTCEEMGPAKKKRAKVYGPKRLLQSLAAHSNGAQDMAILLSNLVRRACASTPGLADELGVRGVNVACHCSKFTAAFKNLLAKDAITSSPAVRLAVGQAVVEAGFRNRRAAMHQGLAVTRRVLSLVLLEVFLLSHYFCFMYTGFLSFEVVIATKSFATFWCTELRYGGKPSNRRLASCAQGEGLAK